MLDTFADYRTASADILNAMDEPRLNRAIESAITVLSHALLQNHPILICGNGGSAADAAHITAELVGRFVARRAALHCHCLNDNTAFMTAWGNDVGFDSLFARQVEAYGRAGGVLWAISTSGNSANVVLAAKQAKTMGMKVLAMVGEGKDAKENKGGKLAQITDQLLCVPSSNTALVQQGHQVMYHYICARLEATLGTPSALDPSNAL